MFASATPVSAGVSTVRSRRPLRAGFRKAALLAALLPMGFGALAAQAITPLPPGYQPTPSYQPPAYQPPSYQPAYQPPYQPSQAMPASLSGDQVAAELQSAGYPTQVFADHSCMVTFQRGDWTFRFNISVSDSRRYVWISTGLTEIRDVNQVSPTALINLLHENENQMPAFFSIVTGQVTKVELTMPIVNSNLTAAELKNKVEDFVKILQDTQNLWSPQTLMPGLAQAAANVQPQYPQPQYPQQPQQPQYPQQPAYPQYVPQAPQPPQDVQQ